MQTDEIHFLVRRAQADDKAAENKLFEMFRPLIRKAARQVHLAPVREDAEQEAALAFLWAAANFDESRGVPFACFAKAIVFGRVRTFFVRERRKWRREILPFDREDEDGESENYFESVADERDEISEFEDVDSFRASLAALPDREQKILSYYYMKGFSLHAIGEKLGMKANHVSVVKARAMKKLRRELGATRTRRKRAQNRRPNGRR